jgi:hypothetical protein
MVLLHLQVEANLDDPEILRKIRAGEYRPTSDNRLDEFRKLSFVWPEGALDEHLHVFVRPKKAVTPVLLQTVGECLIRFFALALDIYLTNLLLEDAMGDIPPDNDLQKYSDIFVKVRKLGKFYEEDINNNDIHDIAMVHEGLQFDDIPQNTALPDFVRTFEEILERKPGLDPVRCFIDLSVFHSILMGQCRRVLHSMLHCSPMILDNILSSPGT